MLKSKWLQIRCDAAPREAQSLLATARFTAEAGSGFELISRDLNSIHCRYIERVTSSEKVVDPFGDTTELEIIRYVYTFFRLHPSEKSLHTYLLEISNPPRTVRPLVSALSIAFDGVTVSEPEWPILEIYKRVKRNSPRARVVRLRACGIPVSETTVSKIELISSENAAVDFLAVFPKSISKIDKIRIERPFIDQPGPLELSVNGVCGFDENVEHLVRGLILGLDVAD
ncbi:hypothetical protein [Roseateles flavus]|uniref:DUF5655 domain-containing protein n=1 Tax=Roseateles flavus TaxID=3149041 RepID=A0ABV0GLG0_9BURK